MNLIINNGVYYMGMNLIRLIIYANGRMCRHQNRL